MNSRFIWGENQTWPPEASSSRTIWQPAISSRSRKAISIRPMGIVFIAAL